MVVLHPLRASRNAALVGKRGPVPARVWAGAARRSPFLAIYCGVVFVFFSASHSKLLPYVLPMMPALAVLLAPHIISSVRAAQSSCRDRHGPRAGLCIYVVREGHAGSLRGGVGGRGNCDRGDRRVRSARASARAWVPAALGVDSRRAGSDDGVREFSAGAIIEGTACGRAAVHRAAHGVVQRRPVSSVGAAVSGPQGAARRL